MAETGDSTEESSAVCVMPGGVVSGMEWGVEMVVAFGTNRCVYRRSWLWNYRCDRRSGYQGIIFDWWTTRSRLWDAVLNHRCDRWWGSWSMTRFNGGDGSSSWIIRLEFFNMYDGSTGLWERNIFNDIQTQSILCNSLVSALTFCFCPLCFSLFDCFLFPLLWSVFLSFPFLWFGGCDSETGSSNLTLLGSGESKKDSKAFILIYKDSNAFMLSYMYRYILYKQNVCFWCKLPIHTGVFKRGPVTSSIYSL